MEIEGRTGVGQPAPPRPARAARPRRRGARDRRPGAAQSTRDAGGRVGRARLAGPTRGGPSTTPSSPGSGTSASSARRARGTSRWATRPSSSASSTRASSTHPDLEGQVVDGYDFVSDPLIGADGDSGATPIRRTRVTADYPPGSPPGTAPTWPRSWLRGRTTATASRGVAPGCRVMPLRAVGRGRGARQRRRRRRSSSPPDCSRPRTGVNSTEPLRIVNLSFGLDSASRRARGGLSTARPTSGCPARGGCRQRRAPGCCTRRATTRSSRSPPSTVRSTRRPTRTSATRSTCGAGRRGPPRPAGRRLARRRPRRGLDDTLHPAVTATIPRRDEPGGAARRGVGRAPPHRSIRHSPAATCRIYCVVSALDRGTAGLGRRIRLGCRAGPRGAEAHAALRPGHALTSPPQLVLAARASSSTGTRRGTRSWS